MVKSLSIVAIVVRANFLSFQRRSPWLERRRLNGHLWNTYCVPASTSDIWSQTLQAAFMMRVVAATGHTHLKCLSQADGRSQSPGWRGGKNGYPTEILWGNTPTENFSYLQICLPGRLSAGLPAPFPSSPASLHPTLFLPPSLSPSLTFALSFPPSPFARRSQSCLSSRLDCRLVSEIFWHSVFLPSGNGW